MGNMDEWHWAVSTEQMLYDASIHNYFLGIFRGRLPFPKWLILRSNVLWPRRFDTFFFSSRLNFKVKIFWPINCPISESTSDFFYVGRHFWFIMRRIGWNICSAKRLNQQCLRRWWIMEYYAASYSSSRRKKNCGSADEKKVSQTIEMCPMLLIKYVLCTLIWLVLVTLRSLNEFDTLIYYLLFLFIQVKNDCPPLQRAKDIIHSQFCKKQKKMLKINSKCSVHVQ